MVAVGAAAAASGRIGPAIWAWLAALLPLLAWRMNSDVELLWLELQPGTLTVRMRWRRERLPLASATARRLTPDETTHLERLATAGGVVAGIGGFESHLLGELDLYASNLANAVLIELSDQRLVVTPDDPDAFLAALSRSATA
jgi:hypothetical protein